jgi:hypothetical protein
VIFKSLKKYQLIGEPVRAIIDAGNTTNILVFGGKTATGSISLVNNNWILELVD